MLQPFDILGEADRRRSSARLREATRQRYLIRDVLPQVRETRSRVAAGQQVQNEAVDSVLRRLGFPTDRALTPSEARRAQQALQRELFRQGGQGAPQAAARARVAASNNRSLIEGALEQAQETRNRVGRAMGPTRADVVSPLRAAGEVAEETVEKKGLGVAPKAGRFGRLAKIGIGLGAVDAALLATEIAVVENDLPGAIRRQVKQLTPSAYRDVMRAELEKRRRERLQAAELSRVQRDTFSNLDRIRQADPDLYNSLLAGQRIPAGARVYGGVPRTDLLEDVAYRMAVEDLGKPQTPDPQQQLAEALGL